MGIEQDAASFSVAIAGAVNEMEHGIERLKQIAAIKRRNDKEALIGRLLLDKAAESSEWAAILERLVASGREKQRARNQESNVETLLAMIASDFEKSGIAGPLQTVSHRKSV